MGGGEEASWIPLNTPKSQLFVLKAGDGGGGGGEASWIPLNTPKSQLFVS